jgi:hypothetical protein
MQWLTFTFFAFCQSLLKSNQEIPLLCCLVHFFIVGSSLVLGGADATAPLAEFNDVFDINGDSQRAFMGMTRYPNFIAEEWSHVLTWVRRRV